MNKQGQEDVFAAPYAPADEDFLRKFLEKPPNAGMREASGRLARDLVRAIRQKRTDVMSGLGGVEDFLHEFRLSSREGLAVMTLAEALIRAPDNPTADLLLADKLASGDFAHHKTASDAPLVQACAFALGFSAKLIGPEFSAQGRAFSAERIAADVARRLGAPVLRAAARRAMALLGGHFVFGETIETALLRAKSAASGNDLHSYDMLGEGARTADDAEKHFDAYAQAIRAIALSAQGDAPTERPGISIKLSALHPRYEAISAERVRRELTPRLLELARLAKHSNLGLTVDAEEADRLELSLDLFGRVAADPALRDWDGLGLAVQAYQKRALAVIDHVAALAGRHSRRFMVRLVKGAYWDSEIKRAQERGLADYPVFSRKPMTDLNYLACAEALLAAPSLFPQFATHNALTAAAIVLRAGERKDYEFQRLHGMGEALHEALRTRSGVSCRVYAPVGPHRELLAYLVRRLIENGANSSFVARAADPEASEESLLTDPSDLLRESGRARHAQLRLPGEMFAPLRKNSRGVEFGDSAALRFLKRDVDEFAQTQTTARPSCESPSPPRKILSPIDGATVGQVFAADAATAAAAMTTAHKAFLCWSATAVEHRAKMLFRVADDIEAQRGPLIALLQREAGKTLDDALAEVREAADLCRYYAAQALSTAWHTPLPGPTGEENHLRLNGRGVFVCISPWNFPLAIFVGQIAAALVAGNAVAAKPAPQTPLVAQKAVALFLGAGCPAGVLQFLPGDGILGATLVSHSLSAGVVFTGSAATAKTIQQALAAKDGPIAPLIAETGGINAMIVDSTALIEQVVDDAVTSAFRSAGQRCSALRLLCLQEDIFAPALTMLQGATRELRVGDPRLIGVHVGPVIDAQAKARLDATIAECAAQSRVVYAGTAPATGSFVAPHIILIERAGDLTTEVFGPVLHVMKWRAGDFSALIREIAANGFGLTVGLHTRIERRIAEFSQAAVAGNIYVNRNMIGAVVGSQPFGGFGLSGTGPKAGGPEYLRRFVKETTLTVNTASFGGDAGLLAIDD
jgi:RHH-type proline utilization regulon transcriptional repressor/proline dehydrogenase/delta 1-pyrroline-5-carboxylate dehydrogenase